MNGLLEKPAKPESQGIAYNDLELSSEFWEKEQKRQIRKKKRDIVNQHKLEEQKRKQALKSEREQRKIDSKLNKLKYRDEVRRFNRKWFNFFTKWFFLGLLLISISIVLFIVFGSNNSLKLFEADSAQNYFVRAIDFLSRLLSTIGIALMVGAVFDFSKNSEAFIQFVSKILSEIVVSKTFLRTLSDKDKEKALALILKPTDKQIEQYSNINEYYNKRIMELTTMFDMNYKTHVMLNITAYMDYKRNSDGEKISDNKIVYCKTVLTQTIYKIGDIYKPIEVLFEKEGSRSLGGVVLPPEGKEKPLRETFKGKEDGPKGGINYYKYIYEIPKEFEEYDHLTVKRTMLEPGYDHWINYYWESLNPYEGLVCIIECMDSMTVKDHMIFDNKAHYYVNKSDDGKRLEITSSQWLETDTGFVVTISDTSFSKDGVDTEEAAAVSASDTDEPNTEEVEKKEAEA